MTGLRHHFRLPWVAVLALVGVLSVAGQASACLTEMRAVAAPGCCAGLPMPECGCCDPAQATARLATVGEAALPAPAGVGAPAPSRPCECGSGVPAAPSSQRESRPGENRPDEARAGFALPALGESPAATLAAFILLTASPPKSPLYLRTERLLI